MRESIIKSIEGRWWKAAQNEKTKNTLKMEIKLKKE